MSRHGRVLVALACLALGAGVARARGADVAAGMHPEFELRDDQGQPVLESLGEVSATGTCGECHDAGFIRAHDSHGPQAHGARARELADGGQLDCFTCHLPGGVSGLEAQSFTPEGRVRAELRAPASYTCGACHGLVAGGEAPVSLGTGLLEARAGGPFDQTLKTGEVWSSQLKSESFLNLEDKQAQAEPWDAHAARGLGCTSCHFAPNNPARAPLVTRSRPASLRADPRTLGPGEYLKRPDHQLASAACTACHDPQAVHRALPSRERHLEALACQACHVSRVAAPAPGVVDATVETPGGGPRLEMRGVKARPGDAPGAWFSSGYEPFLLPETAPTAERPEATRLAPYNLVARWEWVDQAAPGGAPRTVSPEVLRRAWKTSDGAYHADLLPLFDRDGDGHLSESELVLDSAERLEAVTGKLRREGVVKPDLRASLTARPVRHSVLKGSWAASTCQSCHAGHSRLNREVLLAGGALPGGLTPTPDERTAGLIAGRALVERDAGLVLAASRDLADRYVLGHSRPWSDALGLAVFLLATLGVGLHAGLRLLSARRLPRVPHLPRRRVYIYGTYERVWHWVMALCVVVLLATGLGIHFPGLVSAAGYPTVVFLHDATAAAFVINAFLSLFYHLTTSQIRQFIPAREGIAQRLLAQARYYLRGIFARAAHPLARTPENRLNPLQQVTYFALLNLLFPAQVLSGALMWVGGRWPQAIAPLGGLPVLGPLHNLGSWLFLTFLLTHLYLITTGHTLTSNLKAMVDGWDELEVAQPAAAEGGE
jgi:thiosulfate reductase cytochrome b subunit